MPRQAKPLTNTEIRTAKAKDKDYTLHDGGGLYLLVKPTGGKLWNFSYYKPVTKKRALLSFGKYPDVTLSEAREQRHKAKALLAKGVEPRQHREELLRLQSQKMAYNFERVAKDWFAIKKAEGNAESTLEYIWNILSRHIFPAIGRLNISDITAMVVIDAIKPVADAGHLATARKLAQRVNEIMFYAVNSGLIPANPAAQIGKSFAKPTHQLMPSVPPERLPEVIHKLAHARIELQTRCVLQWQLLNIVRPAEAAGTRWDEIDMEKKLWVIPHGRMKMRREHIIPLSEQAIAILEIMHHISGRRDFVFPSRFDPNRPIHRQTANRALTNMGFKGVLVSHGLRSIASTALNAEGFSPDVIEAALAHVDTNTVRRAYNRNDYLEQRRKLMAWWGQYVENAASGSVTPSSGSRGLKVVGE